MEYNGHSLGFVLGSFRGLCPGWGGDGARDAHEGEGGSRYRVQGRSRVVEKAVTGGWKRGGEGVSAKYKLEDSWGRTEVVGRADRLPKGSWGMMCPLFKRNPGVVVAGVG
eukprot:CAMPEP_0174368358 /NCGR_PEP_ID=MMETSP0811_2-20130205/88773_1 /TAXON_ID=73025 ORGANISM="Eutreptiella gymnastica-like, Strain CCMP1594" /NCGR_SAMPLE_ID=MMETSP0811_2 /ASSEMBLY_ACC=CAM_ASM_000667 /LENGTH=109 /DNA_ID=CAMNT_0015511799 /DNA_START=532 /DNA_END=858 /DNA_ORIENTATION=-